MYKLYLNEGVRTLIDVSPNEKDILDTIGDYLKDNPEARFIVIYSQEYGDCIYGVINGYKDYINRLKMYNEKLKNMSCTELKQEIVKDVKVKKKRK